MIRVADDFNREDAYVVDPSLNINVAQNQYIGNSLGGYQLYVQSYDRDKGKVDYAPIETLDSLIPNSISLFVQRSDKKEYVNIYSLYRLNVGEIFSSREPNNRYRDLATRVTAVLYSLNCRQKRQMEQYIRDIEAVSTEQHITQHIADILKKVQDSLNQRDHGTKNVEDMHISTLPADVWAFLAERKLLLIGGGGFDTTVVNNVKSCITCNLGSGYSALDSFKAWTQLNALLRHCGLFLSDEKRHVTVPRNLLEAGAVQNPYNSIYWSHSLATKENPFKAIIAVGDHWIFDPRIRNAAGHILTKSGKEWNGNDVAECAFFPGFGANTTELNEGVLYKFSLRNPEDSFVVRDIIAGTDDDSYDTTLQDAIDYSVRWYGANPPTSSEEFGCGLSEILSRKCGKESFMPDECFRSTGNGRLEFSRKFMDFLRSAQPHMKLAWKGDNVFAVKTLSATVDGAGISLQNNTISTSTYKEHSDIAVMDLICSNSNMFNCSTNDFWPVPFKEGSSNGTLDGAYQKCVLRKIKDKVQGVKIASDKVMGLSDALRMRTEQVNNDGELRSTRLKQAQQAAQQAVSIGTNLVRSINRTRMGTISNVR
jgi:hypothetical protein